MTTPVASSPSLAPSEVVLLNGERFQGYAGKLAKLNASKVRLPHSGEKVPSSEVGFAALAAALLGAEERGTLALQVGEKKGFLGLRKIQTVFVKPGQAAHEFPQGSLEARIGALAQAGVSHPTGYEVDGLVYDLVGEDVPDPWAEAASLVAKGLLARGLAETVQEKKALVFTVDRVVATEQAKALAADAASLQYAERLVNGTREARPDLWEILVKEIREGVGRRREAPDSDGPDFD